MKLKIMSIAMFLFGFVLTIQAQAPRQTAPSKIGVNKHHHKKGKRQQAKVRPMTKEEAVALEKKKIKYHKVRKKALKDGVITEKEKAKLDKFRPPVSRKVKAKGMRKGQRRMGKAGNKKGAAMRGAPNGNRTKTCKAQCKTQK